MKKFAYVLSGFLVAFAVPAITASTVFAEGSLNVTALEELGHENRNSLSDIAAGKLQEIRNSLDPYRGGKGMSLQAVQGIDQKTHQLKQEFDQLKNITDKAQWKTKKDALIREMLELDRATHPAGGSAAAFQTQTTQLQTQLQTEAKAQDSSLKERIDFFKSKADEKVKTIEEENTVPDAPAVPEPAPAPAKRSFFGRD